jgi:hypothetical protein
MDKLSKKQIKSHILDFLQKRVPNFIVKGKMFTCPNCGEVSANIFPPNSDKVHCYSPKCGSLGDIFDMSRRIDFDNNPDVPEDDIAKDLVKEFSIQTDNKIDKLFAQYSEWDWALFPVTKDGKIPLQKQWTSKVHKDLKEWKQWYENGNNLGLRTGDVSNITVIDVDLISKEESETLQKGTATQRIEEILKKKSDNLNKLTSLGIFNNTVTQDSGWKGVHFIYTYESDIPKCSFDYDGLHFDVENNGGYLLIEPSTFAGRTREIKGTQIEKMDINLKQLILENIGKKKEIVSKIDDDVVLTPNDDLIKGLEGKCNSTFVQVGGIYRKFLSVDHTEKVLSVINKYMLDSPMDNKALKTMCQQIEKYHKVDVEVISEQILNHMKLVKDAHVRDLRECLGYDRKDIEQALGYLCDHKKLYKVKKDLYRFIQDVVWQEDFLSLGSPLSFEVPYLEEFNHFESGSMIIIGASSGQGKCFAKGTKVIMFDGSFKEVEKLQPGEQLMGIDSKPRNILQTCTGRDIMYKIESIKGDSFIVNSEHILSLMKTGTTEVLNIKLSDYLKLSKTKQSTYKLYRVPIDFTEQKTNIEPYFLGAWLGDGDSRDSRITCPNEEIHTYLKEYAQRLNQKYVVYEYDNRCKSGKIVRNKQEKSLKEKLDELNVLQNKHIPDIYKYNSRENRLKLLAGLLDTDGYLNDNFFNIITKYDRLSDDIIYLARSLGFFVTHRMKKVKFNFKNGDTYRFYHSINISGKCDIIPTLVKKATVRKINKNPLLTGFKITKLIEDDYYGFFLDGDHLHLLDNFIVNHNTHLAMNFIKKFIDQGIYPHLISTEAGSKFSKVAQYLGIKEGDFGFYHTNSPTLVPIKEKSVTIIDWLKPANSDYAKTDAIYEELNNKLVDKGGLMIVFAQLKTENNSFYAENMVHFYGSVVAKLLYPQKDGVTDNLKPYLHTTKIRDSKINKQYIDIPLIYNHDTKIIDLKK